MKGENFVPSNFWPALDVEGEVIPRIVLVHVPVLLTTKPDVWPSFDRQLRIRGIVAYVTGVDVLPFVDFGDPATGGRGSVFVDDLNLHFDGGNGTADNFATLCVWQDAKRLKYTRAAIRRKAERAAHVQHRRSMLHDYQTWPAVLVIRNCFEILRKLKMSNRKS